MFRLMQPCRVQPLLHVGHNPLCGLSTFSPPLHSRAAPVPSEQGNSPDLGWLWICPCENILSNKRTCCGWSEGALRQGKICSQNSGILLNCQKYFYSPLSWLNKGKAIVDLKKKGFNVVKCNENKALSELIWGFDRKFNKGMAGTQEKLRRDQEGKPFQHKQREALQGPC